MEEHVVNILAGGQSNKFCMLMMLERQLENLMNEWLMIMNEI